MARRCSSSWVVGALAWLAGIPLCAAQQTPSHQQPQELVDPPEVILSASRVPGRSLNALAFPGNATIISAKEIAQSGATTIQEMLSKYEGVTVLDTVGFGLGSDSNVNLRGVVNSSRTNALVLVDGVRQNRLTGDEVHWQAIPLDQIERIEIIRGGGGTIYGEGALAGVINILTKHTSDHPWETEAGLEFGSFGWQRYTTSARGHRGSVQYGTSYSRRLIDGYREFSSSRNTTVTSYGAYEFFPGAQASVNVQHSEDTTAFPGGLKSAEAEQRRRGAVMSRVGLFDDDTDQVSLDLVLGPVHGLSWIVNSFWRQRVVDSRRSNLFTITPSRGFSLRSSYDWVGQWLASRLVNGFELVDDKASTGTRGGARTDESNRQGYGAYLEETLTAWDRLSLVGGFRYDRSRFGEDIVAFDSNFNEVNYVGTLHFEGKSPTIGVTYAVIPDTLSVFGNYARPFKAPNVDDFASRSPDFKGNVSLQPQQADAYEIGARLHRGLTKLNATWFYTKTQDEILFVQGLPGNPFVFQNQNHDTRRFGVECALRGELPNHRVRGYTTYTFVDAEFHKGDFAGSTIPGTPAHTWNAGLGVSPLASLWVDLDWQVMRDYFRINDVTNSLPQADNVSVLNLMVQYELPKALTRRGWLHGKAYLKFQNLTNADYVEFQSSNGHTLATGAGENPMPPFGVIGGLSVNF